MEKGLILKKEIFIQQSKEDIRQRYNIEPKQIGSGAYGKIYLAQPKNKKTTQRAIKIINKQYSNSQFMGQALILRQLDHPNVLKLYQIYEDAQTLSLVTDYFQGGDLLTKLQKGPVSEDQAKEIFKQALQAITYCHSQHVVHRDIKLQNLMFLNSKSLSLKLIDFGLAMKWGGDLKVDLNKQRKCRPVGSILYMAPECFTRAYSQKCDLWSLGVVLYTMIAANFPFQGQNDLQIQKNILSFKFTIPIQQLQASVNVKNLLLNLLGPQQQRLCAQEVFDHPWLKAQLSKAPLKLNFGKLANFSKFSKIKTLVTTYIASQLSQKQTEKLSCLFRQIDSNHDGYLSIEEIKSAFQLQKQKTSLVELGKLLSFIDTDKNGKINYTQFISSCLENSIAFKEENLKAAFRLLDRDNDNRIERNEIIQLLKESERQFDPKAVQQIMMTCDKNGDGFIDYNEFVESISKR